jgi:long-chain acyl-CoA synthetase
MNFNNIAQMLTERAKLQPRKTFLFFHDAKITYSTANSVTNKIAAAMQLKGIEKGDRVAIMLENSPEFIFTLFAAAKCGAVVVPVNTFLKREEVAYILTDSGAKLFVTSSHFEEVANKIEKEVKSLKAVLSYEDTRFRSENFYTISEHLADKDIKPDITEMDSALLIYSSGTTGHPKGAELTHRNLIANASACSSRFNIKEKDRFLLFLPSFHSYAMMTCIILPVFAGASIIILEGVNDLKKKSFKNILIFKRPTFFLGVPQVYTALIKSKMPAWFIKFLYPIKLHVSGGAPLPEETLRQFELKFGTTILEGYGLSEASPVVAVNTLQKQKPMSVGPALDGVQVKIVDENEMEVPVGAVGELIVKGPNVMKGYWNMPGLTESTLRNKWLFTGDLAKVDKDGFIYIVDRKKDLILVKGMNVYPREIEEVLYKYEGIEAAAVIGIPDENSGEVPDAYIKPKEGVNLDVKDIKKYLHEKLANYKIPRRIYIRHDLPLTATGKVLKRLLKQEVLSGKFSKGHHHED